MKTTFWRKLSNIVGFGRRSGTCHGGAAVESDRGRKKVVLVGSPNVGKSVVFNQLTGAYVTVSNYPGTTVDVFRGKTDLDGQEYEIVDTPGMYSLLPITEEERVARSILLEETPEAVLQVVDAKDLERILLLTFQLIEAGLPVMLDLNMMDEVEKAGMEIDVPRLEEELGIPVVTTIGTTGHGMENLRRRLVEYVAFRKQEAQLR